MQTGGIIIDKHFPKNLGQYFMDGFGSDGSIVRGLNWKLMIGKFYVKKNMWNWAQQVAELWNLRVAENAVAVVCIEYIDIKIKV